MSVIENLKEHRQNTGGHSLSQIGPISLISMLDNVSNRMFVVYRNTLALSFFVLIHQVHQGPNEIPNCLLVSQLKNIVHLLQQKLVQDYLATGLGGFQGCKNSLHRQVHVLRLYDGA